LPHIPHIATFPQGTIVCELMITMWTLASTETCISEIKLPNAYVECGMKLETGTTNLH